MSMNELKVSFNPSFTEEPDVIQKSVLGEYGGVEAVPGDPRKSLLLINYPEDGSLAATIPFNMGAVPLEYYVRDVARVSDLLDMTEAKRAEVQSTYDKRLGRFMSFA